MSGIVYDLSHYYDKLNEAFSPAEMTEVARDAAIRDFTLHAQKQRLSIDAAIAELSDPEKVQKFIAIGKMVDGYGAEEGSSEQLASVSNAEIISDLHEDVAFIKASMADFIALGDKTNKILSGVEKAAKETNETAVHNRKILSEVHSAAGELKQNLRHAIDTTRDIVQRLDTFPARLDTQIQKMEELEKGIGAATEEAKKAAGSAATAADNTNPPTTHKENINIMWKSVGWSTVFGTLAGTGLGMIVSHVTATPTVPCKDIETRTETKVIERVQTPPERFILRNKAGKIVYILESVPTPEPQSKNTTTPSAKQASRPQAGQSTKRENKPPVSIPR